MSQNAEEVVNSWQTQSLGSRLTSAFDSCGGWSRMRWWEGSCWERGGVAGRYEGVSQIWAISTSTETGGNGGNARPNVGYVFIWTGTNIWSCLQSKAQQCLFSSCTDQLLSCPIEFLEARGTNSALQNEIPNDVTRLHYDIPLQLLPEIGWNMFT